tara:strand:- start:205 stop:315 length:111 start_codon:yes stop_codon:yes gene_type:complete
MQLKEIYHSQTFAAQLGQDKKNTPALARAFFDKGVR